MKPPFPFLRNPLFFIPPLRLCQNPLFCASFTACYILTLKSLFCLFPGRYTANRLTSSIFFFYTSETSSASGGERSAPGSERLLIWLLWKKSFQFKYTQHVEAGSEKKVDEI